jgi:hypothetical protein
MNHYPRFEKTPFSDELRGVMVHVNHGTVIPFFDYVRSLAHDRPAIRHPANGTGWLPYGANALKFKLVRGVWVTYGQMKLTYYEVQKLQVRAELTFSHDPKASNLDKTEKISFALEESGAVLPALIQSIAEMDFTPLRETGLFAEEDLVGATPGMSLNVWSKKAALRQSMLIGTEQAG